MLKKKYRPLLGVKILYNILKYLIGLVPGGEKYKMGLGVSHSILLHYEDDSETLGYYVL